MTAEPKRSPILRRYAGAALLAVLVAAGLAFALWQPLEPAELLALGERWAAHPAMSLLVALAMALLFVFALPGSLGFWLIAPFQPWLFAVPLLVAASLVGGLGAYALAARLGHVQPLTPRAGRIREVLARRSDLLTLCALRIFPGFPHSVINYAAGALRLPLSRFVVATVVGLGVKFGVYAAAVRACVDALAAGEGIDPLAFWPLLVLALLLLGGVWLRHRLDSGAGPV